MQIQAAVDSKRLEGLLSGKVQLPLTDRVQLCTKPVSGGYSEASHSVPLLWKQLCAPAQTLHFAASADVHPPLFLLQVRCRGGCDDEYCCQACEQTAWEHHHCLLCPGPALQQGTSTSGSGSSSR